MSRRIALVLRGPMGVGKSTVADELCARLAAGRKVVLDHENWLVDRSGPAGRQQRYQGLRLRPESALVVELGCGEPVDLSCRGATQDAMEWHDLLRNEMRAVFLFRLWADWPTIRANMLASRSTELLFARLWHNAYQTNLDVVSLPRELRDQERVIDVTGKRKGQVADEVMAAAGILEHQVPNR